MDQTAIPYEDFGGSGPLLHFAHANGYPPGCYLPLIQLLASRYEVMAMCQRPLWPGSDPYSISDWRPLADDLNRFLDSLCCSAVIGAGHSFGATTTLRLAVQHPDRFTALVLIDPVLFTPGRIYFWRLISRLGLAYRFHPLVPAARRRRSSFPDKAAMFTNFRTKPVFQRLNDDALRAYVDAIGCEDGEGGMTLCYPSEWEARIYVTNMLADLEIWHSLPRLKPPALFVYGAESDTFSHAAAARIKRLLPSAKMVCVEKTGHLIPLEDPQSVFQAIVEFDRLSGA